MTTTITGLPDRYRPLEEIGPAETTPTGVLRCWRAKDRVLNRDVAMRVHTPGGPAARDWITRALTAGGLATPTLAMVYDAAEGSGAGNGTDPAGSAYVVNEWIEGQTLAERLAEGPMPEWEARTVLRRLAEGVAEAHRVGLAVGGISPETVVLRPNGLVGLRSVPATTGTVQGDIAALGELLQQCLTGLGPDAAGPGRPPAMAPDLAALVRRARSTEPGAGLSSVAAMAALLAERPRSGLSPERREDETDSGWLRRLRDRREALTYAADDQAADDEGWEDEGWEDEGWEDDEPAAATQARGTVAAPLPDPRADPPVPAFRAEADDELLPLSDDRSPGGAPADGDDPESRRRRLLVVGLPLLALVVVVALAWWLGSNVLSVAGSADSGGTSTPTAPAATTPAAEDEPAPADVPPATITAASVFDPFGDGEPENPDEVPLSYDGDPATAWSTLQYRGSPAFGNLKDGVGVLYDLGSGQELAGVTLTTGTPGATVEVRVGDDPETGLDGFEVVAAGEIDGTAELGFEEPVTARYVLVWITSLVPSGGGFSADLAEVSLRPAG